VVMVCIFETQASVFARAGGRVGGREGGRKGERDRRTYPMLSEPRSTRFR
jgi:hypothetical protein